MSASQADKTISAIQALLFPNNPREWDGVWGKRSQAALNDVVEKSEADNQPSGVIRSKSSWYSQYSGKYEWHDSEDEPNSNALGVPDDQQGIALQSRSTLGKWFNVTAPNGVTLKLQQTDLGPSKWTHRTIDIAAVAAERFGYTPKSFPTDEGFFTYEPAPA